MIVINSIFMDPLRRTLTVLLLVVFLRVQHVDVLAAEPEGQVYQANGFGVPKSPNAPVVLRKQEAFVAALIDGLEQIAFSRNWPAVQASLQQQFGYRLDWQEDELVLNIQEKIGLFEIQSRTLIKGERKIVKGIVTSRFKNQKMVVQNKKLVFPSVDLLDFPSWENPPGSMEGLKINGVRWIWDRVIGDWWCTVTVSYRFQDDL